MPKVLPQITIKIPTVSLSQFNLFLAMWLGLVLNISFFNKIKTLTPYMGIKSIIFLWVTMLVVVAFYNLILQICQWYWNAKIGAMILIVIGGFSAYFVSSLGITISADQFQNLVQTDAREVKDLISIQFIVWLLGLVIFPLVIFALLPIKSEKLLQKIKSKSLNIVLSLMVVLASAFVFFVDYAAIFREHRDLKGMLSPQNTIASGWSYYDKKRPKSDLPLVAYGKDAHLLQTVAQSDLPKLMVLVVGETARAESFALNGYPRNTNPKLSKQNMINFTQVSSCGTATAVSVPCMFSGMARQNYDEALASHREGLLDIAQRAGYQVTWIDNNSGCKGVCHRVEQYVIPESIKQKWCDTEGECHDEILIESLKAYLRTIQANDPQPRLIVLHQMGSHGPAYYARSTAGFQPFKPTCDSNAIQGCSRTQLINSYDNSIVYTDHVLSGIIDVLKQNQQYQTGFWYLSDHGESTGEHGLYLHGAPYAIAPTQQTHVPMLMWFSSTWQKMHAAQIRCLIKQKNYALSQDNLFPTLLSLLDIQTQVASKNNDLLAQCQTMTRT